MLLNLLKIWRTLSTLLDPYGGVATLAEKITALFALPDVADTEDCRQWTRGLVDLGKTAADIVTTLLGRGVAGLVDTPLERGVGLLAHLVDCDDAWREFYGLLLDLFSPVPERYGAHNAEDRAGRVLTALGPRAVTGDAATFTPALILSVAGLIVQILRYLLDLRKAAAAPEKE